MNAIRWPIFAFVISTSPLSAQDLDRRLAPPRRVFEGADFQPWTHRGAWEKRSQYLREKALVASGLWPLPEKCPLKPVVTATIDCGTYTIENLYFSSYPGFYVTGSLYRPKGPGPFPAVLCAHGHAKHGRLAEAVLKTRDGKPNTDPFSYQARGAGFAQLGCIAFLYDMVGYADSKQVRHPTDAPKVRVPEGTDDFEGLECEMYCLSTLGLQTWNSMRALDYLVTRKDVDPKRLAITGGSGGATQTLMLMMTDDRLAAAAPVCMVSTGFQGDCTCEQAALGKIGTDTVEFCAAFAPKPLIVVGATGDWTKEIIEKGGPEIRATYRLMDAEDNVRVVRFDAPHNYNRKSREAVYEFFNRTFRLGHKEPIAEPAFEPIAPAKLEVFTEKHPRPADALSAKDLKNELVIGIEKQILALLPDDPAKLNHFRRVLGTALRHMTATELPSTQEIGGRLISREGDVQRLTLSRTGAGERVPATLYTPKQPVGIGVVLVNPGKTGWKHILPFTDAGRTVLVVEPFLTGDAKELPPDPTVGFFASFNRTLLAQRVHDILTGIAFLKGQPGIEKVDLIGLREAGTWCLLARGLAGEEVRRAAIEEGETYFSDVKDVRSPFYLPGGLRYSDLPRLGALAGVGEIAVWRCKINSDWLNAALKSSGFDGPNQSLIAEEPAEFDAMARWITRK